MVNGYSKNGYVSFVLNFVLILALIITAKKCGSGTKTMYCALYILYGLGLCASILLIIYGYDQTLFPFKVIECALFLYAGLFMEVLLSVLSIINWKTYSSYCYIKPITIMVMTIIIIIVYATTEEEKQEEVYDICNGIFLGITSILILYLGMKVYQKEANIYLFIIWVSVAISMDVISYYLVFKYSEHEHHAIYETVGFSFLSLPLVMEYYKDAIKPGTLSKNRPIIEEEAQAEQEIIEENSEEDKPKEETEDKPKEETEDKPKEDNNDIDLDVNSGGDEVF